MAWPHLWPGHIFWFYPPTDLTQWPTVWPHSHTALIQWPIVWHHSPAALTQWPMVWYHSPTVLTHGLTPPANGQTPRSGTTTHDLDPGRAHRIMTGYDRVTSRFRRRLWGHFRRPNMGNRSTFRRTLGRACSTTFGLRFSWSRCHALQFGHIRTIRFSVCTFLSDQSYLKKSDTKGALGVNLGRNFSRNFGRNFDRIFGRNFDCALEVVKGWLTLLPVKLRSDWEYSSIFWDIPILNKSLKQTIIDNI
jgi:hypothetical protein